MAIRKNNSNNFGKFDKLVLPESAFEQAILAWEAPEFLRYQRGWVWYSLALFIDVALIAYAWWSDSWTMIMVFLLVPLIYLLEHRVKPQWTQVIISPYGIRFGILRLPYSQIRRFWILHELPYVDELHLLTNNRLHPEVVIPLMGMDPSVIREILVTQVPEWEGKQVTFLDAVVRFLRLN